MRKLVYLLAAFFVGTLSVGAQNGPVLKFDNKHHDFGDVKEEQGSVSHTYKFRNDGNSKLILTSVRPSCGCTLADFSKDSIAPGGEGYVKINFDLNHKLNRQDKSITVYSNSNPNVDLLSFSAFVHARARTWSDTFTHQVGNLYFESGAMNFDALKNNVSDTSRPLRVYNSGDAPIVIKELRSENKYISFKDQPVIVLPKQRGKVYIHYAPDQVNDYGIMFDQVRLITTDTKVPEKTLTIFAEIRQYVKPWPPHELDKAPKIFFAKNLHDFGNIKQGETATTEFVFTNKGKSELVIYKAKASCSCTTTQPDKSRLKKGESSKIKVAFHSAGMTGQESKNITVYTNDPSNPEITLTIKGVVVAPDASGATGGGK